MQQRLHWFEKVSIRERMMKILIYLVVGIGLFFFMIPLFWMISTSLKEGIKAVVFPPQWIPEHFIWRNYIDVFTQYVPFGLYMYNSMVIVSLTVVGQVISGALVAFGFARLRAPGKNFLFVLLLSTLMIPFHVTLIPLYSLFRSFGWLNSWRPLWVPSYFGGSAFYIFLMRQYFMTIPLEMDDSARIDGCNTLQIFYKMIIPMSKPILAVVGIFTFVASWNGFLGPLIYLDDSEKYTVTLGLMSFQSYIGGGAVVANWPLMMAASIIAILPPAIIFFLAQKIFVQGIVLTGIKG